MPLESQPAGDPNAVDPQAAQPGSQSSATPNTSASAPAEGSGSDAPAQPTFLDTLRERGFTLPEDADEAAAREQLLSAYEDREREAARLRDEQQQLRAMAAYYQQQAGQFYQQPAQQPAQPSQPDSWWNPPQVDQVAVSRYRVPGEDGRPSWAPNTPPEVIAAGEKYAQYIDQWANDLLTNPDKVLPNVIARVVDERVEQILAERAEQERTSQFANSFANNYPWVFDRDPVTQQIKTDPVSGQYVFSKHGARAAEVVRDLVANGMTNIELAWRIADQSTKAERTTSTPVIPTQVAPTAPTPAAARRDLLQRGAGVAPNRNGTFRRPEGGAVQPAQNPHMSPGQQLVERLRESGLLTNGSLN